MVTVDNVIEFGKYLTIIHHTKDRVRLRVDSGIEKSAQGLSVDTVYDLPQYIQGINKIKINKLVGSITVNYDSSIFAPSLWDEILKGNVSDEIRSNLTSLLESKGE